jgi:hypothetical protein
VEKLFLVAALLRFAALVSTAYARAVGTVVTTRHLGQIISTSVAPLPSSGRRTVLIAIGRRLHFGHMTMGTFNSGFSFRPIAESPRLIAGELSIVSSSDILSFIIIANGIRNND